MQNLCYMSASKLISSSANSVHVMKMCAAFARSGLSVKLEALKGDGSDDDVFYYYGAPKIFRIEKHNENIDPAAGAFWNFRRISGIPVSFIPSIVYGIRKFRKKEYWSKYDVFYGRNIPWIFSLPASLPFAMEKHAPPLSLVEKLIEKQLFKRKNFRGLVVISDALKEIYTKEFPQIKGRILVAHDGADDPLPEKEKSVKNDRIAIGYIGHLYQGRGIELILELAKLLPDVTFSIIGGEPADVDRFRTGFQSPNITFYGHLPHNRLKEFYPQFDIMLAPYQKKVAVYGNAGNTSDFMSPLKIFEYMSWGKAILASDLPALREVLTHKKNAFLLPPGDMCAWENTIKFLKENPDQILGLGKVARENFLSHYTWDSRAQKIVEFIGESNRA